MGLHRIRETENEKDGNIRKRLFSYLVCSNCKEEFIPEGLELRVIEKMREAGMKVDSAAEYAYMDKSGECMVEVCTMEFAKCVKGC